MKFDKLYRELVKEQSYNNNTMMKYMIIDLYSGKSEELPTEEFKLATKGLKKVEGVVTVYRGEEYIVVVLPNQ